MGLQRVRHDLVTKQFFLYFSFCSLPPCSPLFVFFSSTMFCLKEERRSVDKKTSTSFSWEGKKSPWTGDSLCPLSRNLRNCICSALELLPRFPLWASNRRAWVKSCAGRQAASESSRTTLPATRKGRQVPMMSSELLNACETWSILWGKWPQQFWEAVLSESHSVVSDSVTPWTVRPPGSSVHGILQARILE